MLNQSDAMATAVPGLNILSSTMAAINTPPGYPVGYVTTKTNTSIFISIWSILMLSLSVIFNSIGFFTIIRYHRPLKLYHKLLMTITIADALQSTIGYVPEIMLWVNEDVVVTVNGPCVFSGYIIFVFAAITISVMSTMSVLQCISLVNPLHYRTLFQYGKTRDMAIVGLCVVYAFFFPSLPFANWSKYEVDLDQRRCSLDWRTRHISTTSYIATVIFCYYILPCILLSGSTFLSLKTIKSRAGVFHDVSSKDKQRFANEERDTVNLILAKGIVWYVTWTPYGTCGFLAVIGYDLPNYVTTICSVIVKSSTVLNPLVNLRLEKKCRQKVLEVIRMMGSDGEKEKETRPLKMENSSTCVETQTTETGTDVATKQC